MRRPPTAPPKKEPLMAHVLVIDDDEEHRTLAREILARAGHRVGLHADVPVIAVSGGGAQEKDELLLKAVRLGAAEVIMKPFDFRQLLGAVERVLTLRR